MIDDLVPMAVYPEEGLSAAYDWGYLMRAENSLWIYLEKNLFSLFPEIKGTIFTPTESHLQIQSANGYSVKQGSFEASFGSFLASLYPKFDLAYHGSYHTKADDTGSKLIYEHAETVDLTRIKASTGILTNAGSREITGGKFPGYVYNSESLEQIKLKFKWWALDCDMINRVGKGNGLSLNDKLVLVPTNVSGSIFSQATGSLSPKDYMKRLLRNRFYKNPEALLEALYHKRLPITIQEHAQNQSTSGRRQTPNLYDDLDSLKRIYTLLKGKDIWYATCSELAHYFDSYTRSSIEIKSDNIFTLIYDGIWDAPYLSLRIDCPQIIHLDTDTIIKGIPGPDGWIFNLCNSGKYHAIIKES